MQNFHKNSELYIASQINLAAVDAYPQKCLEIKILTSIKIKIFIPINQKKIKLFNLQNKQE